MVTKNRLALLPDINGLKRLSQSLAMLDAIMSPEWEYRYYSFDSKWSEDSTMGSMRDGSGNEYFILFDAVGAAIKGFDHESPMSPYANNPNKIWPGVLENVPSDFASFLQEPAFSMQHTTLCLWRKHEDPMWQIGDIKYPDGDETSDGSEWLLGLLDNNPEAYRYYAEQYYQENIPLEAIKRVYAHKPLSEEVVHALNAKISLAVLTEDAEEIGYPIHTS